MTTPMTRDDIVELMARAVCYEYDADPDVFIGMHGSLLHFTEAANALLRALEAAGCQIVQGEPVGYQRRYLYEPGAPGSFALWEQCSKEEATGHFEKMAGHEYRAIFAGKVQP